MNKVYTISRASVWFVIIVLTAMSFCWSERLSSIGIILLITHWFIDFEFKQKVKRFKWDRFLVFSAIFFFLHIIGLSRSMHWATGWQSVEVKMSFIILPILFSTEHHLNQMKRNWLLFFFTLSCCSSFLYTAWMSYSHYHQLGIMNVLGRMNLSEAIMHPGYYSNYLGWAFVWCTVYLINKNEIGMKRIFCIAVVIIFLGTALLFLSSKTAWLYLFIFIIFAFWRFSKIVKDFYLRRMLFITAILLSLALVFQIPSIKYRVLESRINITSLDKNVPLSNSTGSRIVAWQQGWEIVKVHFFLGSGTADANILLNERLLKEGYLQLAKDDMHIHNQVLFTWISIGLLGVISLLLFLAESFSCFYKKKDLQAIWFIPLILLNILTDDMLEIQAGSVFFLFFLSLFIYQKDLRTESQ